MLLLGLRTGSTGLFRLLPEDIPPARGADGPVQLRPSTPARQDQQGLQPCAGRRAGIAQAAVELQRQRSARSASGLVSCFSPLLPFLVQFPLNCHGGLLSYGGRGI